MDSLRRILAFFFFSSLLVLRSRAAHAFNWGFGPNFIQTSFPECSSFAIELIPLNTSTTDVGVPPYYMMAFANKGTTIVSSLGNDSSHLSWQVQHPSGSSLLLTVIDSIGQTGGFTNQFFDVVDGDTTCQPPAPTNPAVVTPNITSTLNTCEPWGLTITGGVKPYNVSLAAVASPVVTNVTMGPEDDVFTFIDRADPGMQILAAVVDATGQWGISSVAVPTAGSTDTDCVGLISTSKTKAEVQSQAAAAAALAKSQSAKAKRTAIALGIVFGLVLPLILAGGAYWWWRRRRRVLAAQQVQPFTPGMEERGPTGPGRPSLNVDTSVVRVDNQPRRSPSWVVDINRAPPRQTDSPTSIDMASTDLHRSTVPTPFLTSPQVQSSVSMIRSPASQLPQSAVSRSMSMARSPFPPISAATSPLSPPEAPAQTPNSTSPAATLSPEQRYRKMLEAHAEAQAARARLASSSSSSLRAGPSSRPLVHRSQTENVRPTTRSFPAQSRRAGSSLRLPPVSTISEVGPDIIIQHRDGGIVEELPPPYPATPLPRPAPARPRSPSPS